MIDWRQTFQAATCCAANYKTSSMGLLLIILAAYEIMGNTFDHITPDPLDHVIAGIGLIFAKDAGTFAAIRKIV